MPDTSQAFFEQKYQQATDPWAYASSAYEQNKYDSTILALKERRFRRVFEPGCSVGVLTERLAQMSERLEAIDISPTAVRRARERCRDYPNVEIREGGLPDAMPDGRFDLIVFSEIGYYFEPDVLGDVAGGLVDRLETGGVLLAVHWLGRSTDHRLTGDEVHLILGQLSGLRPWESQRYEGFRLDSWLRV